MNDKRFKWFLVPCSNCRLRGHACLMLCLTFLNRRHYDESLCPKNAILQFKSPFLAVACLCQYPVNQRRLYNDYPTVSKRPFVQRLPNVFQTSICPTTTQRIPNVHDVWKTSGSRWTNVAGSLGSLFFPLLFLTLFQA